MKTATEYAVSVDDAIERAIVTAARLAEDFATSDRATLIMNPTTKLVQLTEAVEGLKSLDYLKARLSACSSTEKPESPTP